ncbi:diguanylate cyclase/phosphodiesterase (GGDEF & EAL domains) with PAS/PAC sensor(s) [hydrothermal vent metagenome]|uniref:Diguanylate cyclase/phosphodiesterase (GGDEF & EAL domains) with PAS/PAC sensor(S) n=1 Tax=hydrothermal vent metagenome TaxID=652676 RepID=A0A3B0XV54_9ZZZZ
MTGKLATVDEELSQCIARFIISGVSSACLWVWVYIYDQYLFQAIFDSIYFLISILWLIFVKYRPGNFVIRRGISIISDLGMTSLFMSYTSEMGAALLPLYLWIIVGNGMRFGQKYLLFAIIVGAAGFGLVLLSSEYWLANRSTGLAFMAGIIILPLFYLKLLSRLHALNEQLQYQLIVTQYTATHDGLTGLVNRDEFFWRLDDEIKVAKRYNKGFAVIYLDLDGFKQVNDTYGHQCGDELLIEVACRLSDTFREVDVNARLGGDEFAAMLREVTGADQVEPVIKRLLNELSQPYSMIENKSIVSASIGISLYPENGESTQELINKSDFAMYSAKKSGKNRCVFFSDEKHLAEFSARYNS